MVKLRSLDDSHEKQHFFIIRPLMVLLLDIGRLILLGLFWLYNLGIFNFTIKSSNSEQPVASFLCL